MNDRPPFNAFRNHLNCTPAAAQDTNRAERLWTGFSSVAGMAFDKSGNLFAAEWSAGRISRVEPDSALRMVD